MAGLQVGDIFTKLFDPPRPVDGISSPRADSLGDNPQKSILRDIVSSAIKGGSARAFSFFSDSQLGREVKSEAIKQQAQSLAGKPWFWWVIGLTIVGLGVIAFRRG